MRWRRKRIDLVERLRPYVNTWPPLEPMVDADPIRIFLIRWMAETGDSIEVVARGFDIEPQVLGEVLGRRLRHLPEPQAVELRRRMGLPTLG